MLGFLEAEMCHPFISEAKHDALCDVVKEGGLAFYASR